ncbi:MAG: zinc dependent phospholipase C family protein [Promethearchaeati archaeon SRVP18_Atabeyarchaeia-1]
MADRESWLKITSLALFGLIASGVLISGHNAMAWSNGGYSSDPNNPDYGSHDWIAEHAIMLLPANESGWLSQNKNAFIYGTEAPDNGNALFEGHNGYGDTTHHHNYYSGTTCVDASAANRAGEEYQKALNIIRSNGSLALAAWYAGAMTHYIDDVGCWAHVMSGESSTAHSNFESQVDSVTGSYGASTFSVSFDGTLETISAHDASVTLGLNTYNDNGGTYTATWMNANFNTGWSNVNDWPTGFKGRTAESLNLAVNIVAASLHTLTVEGRAIGVALGGPRISLDLLLEIAVVAVIAMVVIYSVLSRRELEIN